AGDVLDARAQHHELQKIGNDMNRYDAARQPLEERLRRAVGQRNEDVIDILLLDDALHVLDRAEAFEVLEREVVAVSQIPGDVKSELAMRSHPLHHRARKLAAAGDDDAVDVLARAVPQIDDAADEHPSTDDEQ